jgi:hypothetical protein
VPALLPENAPERHFSNIDSDIAIKTDKIMELG